ncbi:DUF294 nucleotidyltransferase-like domain-containing protein [Ferrimonas pelagia]|uniref:DUF294 nucleotidyltransferase-like domain-containing protein n=1 Tax=Ferrimonas pelagia TaxID=1177826 RepID=A0ABP9EPI8_9GAMM
MSSSELAPIVDFLATLHPFDRLSSQQLEQVGRGIEIAYFAHHQGHVPVDYCEPKLYVVRNGAFEVQNDEGDLLDRLGEGDYFGYPSLLTGEKISNRIRVLEDGLVYILSDTVFRQLRSDCREFDRFFNRKHAERLRHGARFLARDHQSTARVKSVMASPAASIGPELTVQAAAKQMQAKRISCLLVVQEGQLVGILTDRDLRNRILAEGKGCDTRIAQVMTTPPLSVNPATLVFEAMLIMSRHNIHHLPVVDKGEPVGVVTSTDMIRMQRNDPLHLIGEMERQSDRAELVKLAGQFPVLMQSLIQADARAEEIGRVLTLLTDTLTRRLLIIAQEKFGAAPIPWCWLAFGSQARMDQAGKSDQDNGLLLAREPDAAQMAYFQDLSRFVCDGLNDAGYVYCPGNIMAMNPKWCLSKERWLAQFKRWTQEPEPIAVMHASIFFDLRPVAGNVTLGQHLQQQVLKLCQGNQIFLAMMAANGGSQSPPLGFFRQLVLERDGEQRKALNLKHKGVALINDIARLYALSCGSSEVSTPKRIQAAMLAGLLTRKDALNLADALEFIAHLRLQNQGRQVQEGEAPSNWLATAKISGLMRHQLKDAFAVVARAQDGMKLKYGRTL